MARRLGVTSPLQVRWLYLRVALVSCYPEANFGPSDKRQTENTVLFGQTVISGLAAGSMVAIEKKSRRCVAAAKYARDFRCLQQGGAGYVRDAASLAIGAICLFASDTSHRGSNLEIACLTIFFYLCRSRSLQQLWG